MRSLRTVRGVISVNYMRSLHASTCARRSSSSCAVSQQDGMPRLPSLRTPGGVLRACDHIGTVVFAASGSIAAATCGLDLFGATAIGSITAVGGGTVRDAIILHKRAFWIEEYEYLWLAAASAVTAFFVWPVIPEGAVESIGLKDSNGNEGELMWWGDALGVGAFAVIGAMNGARMGVHPSLAVLCGVSTATFGGLTRDVLCGMPGYLSRGRILHSSKELYACTAAAGAAVYVAALRVGLALSVRLSAGVLSAMAMRWLARRYEIGLPTWGQMDLAVDRPKPAQTRPPDAAEYFTPQELAILKEYLAAGEMQREALERMKH